MATIQELQKKLDPHKEPDKQFYLDFLDEDKQLNIEKEHLADLLTMLKLWHINPIKKQINAHETFIKDANFGENAGKEYPQVLRATAEIKALKERIEEFRCFFDEPYFARMDLVDDKEGYNSYYIGKRGDIHLEIVDWRAPLARKYYQKSQINFKIGEYDYKLILRRAFRTRMGALENMKNEYLNLKDFLSKEEIGGRDDSIIFDPYLREILAEKKEQPEITDIIETIQEKQYEVIVRPERENLVLQGCAGSGKTMVLLHRLSFLMYNNDGIKPRDILALTPSDSFNDFMNELATVLELEKVQTTTISDYFLRVLRNEGIDIRARIDFTQTEAKPYLAYIYSRQFVRDIDAFVRKTFTGIYDMFASEESREYIQDIVSDAKTQADHYEYIRNASARVRRAIMGEIKEKADGGIFYTKPFRELMSSAECVREFLAFDPESGKMKNSRSFYKLLFHFRKGLRMIVRHGEGIISDALNDLETLKTTVQKEIEDLVRYKIYVEGEERFTYPDRIERRKQLVAEIETCQEKVRKIGDSFVRETELSEILEGNADYAALGGAESTLQLSRFFYRELVRKTKRKYGMESPMMYKSDAYAIALILSRLGTNLSPAHSFVFIDEGQDISANEYDLLHYINREATFNIFGDLAQNMTDFRGISDWSECGENLRYYTLNQNYRNTNEIVQFVSERLTVDMLPIGFSGSEVEKISPREITAFFRSKKGLKAVITSEESLEKYRLKSYHAVRETGKIDKKKINILTAFEAKGLEFSAVAVVDEGMSEHERYIAYTRALKDLAVVTGRKK